MRPNDSIPDRELARALRRLDPAAPTSAQMAALARRIIARATPLLAVRRRASSSWWEYAAAWSSTLLPLGVAATFLAAVCLAWSSAARPLTRQHAPERTALLKVMTNQVASRELIDFALDAPAAEHVAGLVGGSAR